MPDTEHPTYVSAGIRKWRRWTDTPLVILAISSLPLLLLETQRSDLRAGDRLFLDLCNIVVLIAFATDYLVEFALARHRTSYIRGEWTSLLIVATQFLALLPQLSGFGVFRALRGLRLMRIFLALARALAIGGMAAREGRSILRRRAATFALFLAAFTWLSSAVAFTLAEDVGENGRLESFFDALWWATTTITTVGYGDVYPVTITGRIIGAFTMVVGISTFAIVTAKIAEFLVRKD